MTDKHQVEELEQQQEGAEAKEIEVKGAEESAAEPTPEDLLQQKNEALEGQVAELKDKYMRKVAEFENFRKRTMRERLELTKTAARDTMSAILPILDDFERAEKNAGEAGLGEGTTIVLNKLHKVLDQRGLKAMESNGEAFDPELHEAITEIPAPTEELKGKIVDTVEKGYYLGEKIIRYAKVVVGK